MRWLAMTLAAATLVGLYNGKDVANLYAIGAATKAPSAAWVKDAGNPVLEAGTSGAWDDGGVKDPVIVRVSANGITMLYSGYDGSTWRTGVATAPAIAGPWTKHASNPVLDVGASGAFDDSGIQLPAVLYEPADTGREYKLWYGADDGSGGGHGGIGYAYSSDGISWTKYGRVIDIGTAGSWTDEGLMPGAIIKDGSTYYLFVGGRQGTTNPLWHSGLWTFTDPEGTYTADAGNPIMLPRYHDDPGTSQSLTADTLTGSAVVTVASTAKFNVGEPMALADGNSATHISEIASIDSGTQVTLDDVTIADFTTAQSAVIRPMARNSVLPRTVRGNAVDGYEAWVSAFQPVEDLTPGGNKLREGVVRMTASDPEGPWSYDHTTGLVFPLGAEGSRWDAISSENLTAYMVFAPAGFGIEVGFNAPTFTVEADRSVFPSRFGIEVGFREGLRFRSGARRQLMLTGGGIETPEMTTATSSDVGKTVVVTTEGFGFVDGGSTPATTVESETTWGITPAVGTDASYARQDHTHGTPAAPTGEPFHPLLIADDHSTPIVFADLLLTEEGDDLLYADIGG